MHSAVARSGRSSSGLRGRGEAGLGEIGGMSESGGIAHDDSDPRPPVTTGGEVLDLAVVKHGVGGGSVLYEHLSEITASAQRGSQGALDEVVVEHSWPSMGHSAFDPMAWAGNIVLRWL